MNRDELIKRLKSQYHEIEPDQPVEIGLFRPEDALGVCLAYYEIYGDAFPIAQVYDPEETSRRNATDEQHTIVARTPSGDVVGLMGLFRNAPAPGVYEGGQLMVVPSYRISHTAEHVFKAATDLQYQLRLPVLFGEAVCNHPVTQRLSKQNKFPFTGLEMECMPMGTYSKEANTEVNVSLLLGFRLLEPDVQAIHLHPAYRDVCLELYAPLELTREIKPGADLSGASEASEFLLPDADLARVTVSRAGADFEPLVVDVLGKAGLVQVYLNLGDPAAPAAVDLLRQHGFCFGGLLPMWFGSDGLVMQHLPKEPEWDALRLCTKSGKALRDLVRKDYEAVQGGRG